MTPAAVHATTCYVPKSCITMSSWLAWQRLCGSRGSIIVVTVAAVPKIKKGAMLAGTAVPVPIFAFINTALHGQGRRFSRLRSESIRSFYSNERCGSVLSRVYRL